MDISSLQVVTEQEHLISEHREKEAKGVGNVSSSSFFFFRFLFIYFQREEKGGLKRGREPSVGCLLHTLSQGPDPQPRHVP